MEKPRLLLFDDDEKTIDLTGDALEDYFDVTLVTLESQLDDIITDDFAVIVTDVSIKDSDRTGYQILDELRRKYKITRTPIVVYSAKVNINSIQIEQGKLFFRYVDKATKTSNDELLEACIAASKEKKNLVSWNTFESYFEKNGIIDKKIDPGDLSRLTPFIDTSALETHRQLIAQLKKPDLEDDIWNVLEDLAWEIYQRNQQVEIN